MDLTTQAGILHALEQSEKIYRNMVMAGQDEWARKGYGLEANFLQLMATANRKLKPEQQRRENDKERLVLQVSDNEIMQQFVRHAASMVKAAENDADAVKNLEQFFADEAKNLAERIADPKTAAEADAKREQEITARMQEKGVINKGTKKKWDKNSKFQLLPESLAQQKAHAERRLQLLQQVKADLPLLRWN